MGRAKVSTFQSAFDSFERVRQVGQGGAGTVVEARNQADEHVAIKYLSPEGLTDERVKRFKNELSFCAKNKHPRILKVLDWGWVEIDGAKCPFYVMPLYSGSLRDLLNAGINAERVLPMFTHLLDGVEAAHLQGVCHRDLKPENVLFDNGDESLVVADFGIARFAEPAMQTVVETRAASRLANFHYAAPEQRERGASVEERADIYALALMLNEMYTGRVPLGQGYAKIGTIVPALSYLDDLVETMLMQDPEQRPASITHVKQQLIARGNQFVQEQKLSELKQRVIPAVQADDPLIDAPPEILEVKWDDRVLIFTLSAPVNELWIECFKNPGSHGSVLGFGPERFRIRGTSAKIGVVDDKSTAQRIVDYTKDYVRAANQSYKARVEREVKERQRQAESALREQVAEAEKARAINDSLKW